MRRRALSIVITAAAALAGVGVSAPAATAMGAAPHYVQLGDSYSAGNGGGSYTDKTCWRSPNNYGARVAQLKGATYTNAACSGGVIDDILTPRELGSATLRTKTYRVPADAVDARAQWLKQAKDNQLCGVPTQPDFSYRYTFSSNASAGNLFTATVRCQLMAKAQIDSVTTSTDAVFVNIGGNDIGFTSIVTNCLVLRSAASCKTKMDTANAALTDMQTRTKQVLKAVHQRSGGRAQVYLLGYPYLINTASYKLSSAYDAGLELERLQDRGDALQRAAMLELDTSTTGKGGFTFVDVKRAWGGHTHGLDPRPIADNRNAWLVPVLGAGNVYYEWVHPSPAGWGASALALSSVMG